MNLILKKTNSVENHLDQEIIKIKNENKKNILHFQVKDSCLIFKI